LWVFTQSDDPHGVQLAFTLPTYSVTDVGTQYSYEDNLNDEKQATHSYQIGTSK